MGGDGMESIAVFPLGSSTSMFLIGQKHIGYPAMLAHYWLDARGKLQWWTTSDVVRFYDDETLKCPPGSMLSYLASCSMRLTKQLPSNLMRDLIVSNTYAVFLFQKWNVDPGRAIFFNDSREKYFEDLVAPLPRNVHSFDELKRFPTCVEEIQLLHRQSLPQKHRTR
jgi:hypothetical protein